MYYNLNPLSGVIQGVILGTTMGVIKGDARSLDYGSCTEYHLTGLSGTSP